MDNNYYVELLKEGAESAYFGVRAGSWKKKVDACLKELEKKKQVDHEAEILRLKAEKSKLPSLEEVEEYCDTSGHGLVPNEWIKRIYETIKKLGNFQ